MKKKMILIPLIIVAGIIILYLFSSLPWMIILILEPILQPIFPQFFISPECEILEQKIIDKVDELNYCTIDEDCSYWLRGASPLACVPLLLNKNELNYTELNELIKDYDMEVDKLNIYCFDAIGMCSDLQEDEIKCINNKCVISEGAFA